MISDENVHDQNYASLIFIHNVHTHISFPTTMFLGLARAFILVCIGTWTRFTSVSWLAKIECLMDLSADSRTGTRRVS